MAPRLASSRGEEQVYPGAAPDLVPAEVPRADRHGTARLAAGGRLGGGWRREAKGLNLPSTALLSRQRISVRTKRF